MRFAPWARTEASPDFDLLLIRGHETDDGGDLAAAPPCSDRSRHSSSDDHQQLPRGLHRQAARFMQFSVRQPTTSHASASR